jgi:hypothetical protein
LPILRFTWLLLLLIAAPASADTVRLVPYRSVEDLALDPGATDQSVAAVSGRLVTEFTGSACAGYTTTTRMVVQVANSDGGRKVSDTRTVTFEKPAAETRSGGAPSDEAGAGQGQAGRLDFDNQSFTDGKPDEASKGTAVRSGNALTVQLALPEKKTVTLDGGLVFPTEQVMRLIDAARAGKHFLAFTAYDGLDDGESPAPTSMTIGKGTTDPSDIGDETAVAEAGIAGMQHWPVTVSFFDKGVTTDQAANFTLTGIVYENGVMREQRLDFGNFTLTGKMVGLEMLPAKPCP